MEAVITIIGEGKGVQGKGNSYSEGRELGEDKAWRYELQNVWLGWRCLWV